MGFVAVRPMILNRELSFVTTSERARARNPEELSDIMTAAPPKGGGRSQPSAR
jgi:hypothetical protein